MASLALSPGHYGISSQDKQHNRRSATLSRLLATATVHPPSQATNGKMESGEPSFTGREQSDFTRVRRINTLRYVAQERPNRRRAKSKSLHGSYDGGSSSSSSSSSRRRRPPPFRTYSKEGSNSDVAAQLSREEETETQEVSLDLRASFSSTSSSSCDTSQEEEPEDKDSDKDPSLSLCAKCQGFINQKDDPFIIFGDDKLHLDCFKCGQCSKPMGSMETFLVDSRGQPLCLVCTPSCYACRNKILQNHVSVLKKDFHEDCLACFQCKQKFTVITKVYANEGDPCCSKCISPVFSEKWSPLRFRSVSLPPPPSGSSTGTSLSTGSHENGVAGGVRLSSLILSPSPSTDSGVSETASNDGVTHPVTTTDEVLCPPPSTPPTHHQLIVSAAAKRPVEVVTLNPKLESLTRSIVLYSPSSQPAAIRPSYSEPNLVRSNVLPSLRSLLYDENGVTLFLNYCVNNDFVEFIVFWLDVEHFKHFDGSSEDLKLFAHHIVTKYIGYYAEVPVPLPREYQRTIFNRIESKPSQDLFNEAQQYVYSQMEKELLGGFLRSEDGENYLKMLADRELYKLKQLCPSEEDLSDSTLHATITNFDKRRLDTKFYVYEVEVNKGNQKYHIYRRYSEWYSLNQGLRKTFPLEKFPPLPKKIFLGRSQKRTVARQRMWELQVFLQGLLSMSSEVVNSVLLRRFFRQTDSDKEDEIFSNRIQELQSRQKPSS